MGKVGRLYESVPAGRTASDCSSREDYGRVLQQGGLLESAPAGGPYESAPVVRMYESAPAGRAV